MCALMTDSASGTRQNRKIPARDGFLLASTVFGPVDVAASRVVIINSATAIPRRFYRHFAAALARAGYLTVTYDYRGTGGSRPKRLRGFRARMRDWGLLDMAGVVDWASTELKPDRLFMVGHSVGGQVTGLLDNAEKIDGMITMSAQSGHWRLQGGEQKYVVCLHTYVTLPMFSHLFGYMPRWLLGGEDLPKDAALEWARWCRDREYLLGDDTLPLHRYEHFSAPILAYSFGDDKWGTAESVDAMMQAYPNVERRHVEPSEAGLESIGHVGYFKQAAQALWQDAIDWLKAR